MSAARTIAHAAAGLLAAVVTLHAQVEPKPASRPTVSFSASHAALLANLHATAASDAAASDAAATTGDETPRSRLEAFIVTWQATHATEPRLLAIRCRLATMLLTAFEASGAEQQFRVVLERAPKAQRELRGRALYGLAQARELRGDFAGARRALRRTIEEARDLRRYRRFAEIALRRLDRGPLRVGTPAPALGPRRDIEDKPRQLADYAGRFALIVFATLSDDRARAELRSLFNAAREAGMELDSQVLIFATDAETSAITTVLANEQWDIPVILCDREFLDADALSYGVRQLPATYLIGADGSLLARGPTPRGLRSAVQR